MSAISLLAFGVLLLLSFQPIAAEYIVDSSFKLDVHSHVIPDVYRKALIAAGYPVTDGTLYADGFPVPVWNLTSHIAAMDEQGVNYSTISISAPGLNFLAGNASKAASLARQINNLMYNYTQQYPTRIGAMCLLPLPDVENSISEIEVSQVTEHHSQHHKDTRGE